MISEPNIVITGFMGTGKSTVGALVAKALRREFIDTDLSIQESLGCTIAEIFAAGRESQFRRAEQELIGQLALKGNLVIATGGGTLLSRATVKILSDHLIFCLNARPESIVTRLTLQQNFGTRPLLDHDQLKTDIENLLDDRFSLYQRFQFQIDSDALSVEKICEHIVSRFSAWRGMLSPHTLTIEHPSFPSYPVIIKKNFFEQLPLLLCAAAVAPELIFLVDTKLESYLEKALILLGQKNFSVSLIYLTVNEHDKSLTTAAHIYQELLERRCSRAATIIAVGGGIIGDIAGFIAATYQRGVNVILVPTTLLSMVDSCIGGKNAVNLGQGKNFIGTFKQPLGVLVDTQFLNSLPRPQLSDGLAEVIKHGIIGDEAILNLLETQNFDYDELIAKSLRVKAHLVARDPYDRHQRRWLNLGHTFGHAFEIASDHRVSHGQAVAVGMLAAIRLSILCNMCNEDLYIRIQQLLITCALPINLAGLSVDHVLSVMHSDKKREGQDRYFIVPREIGNIEIVKNPPAHFIKESLQNLI